MSTKPAAIPFFGDAYLADTTHLTTEEHGAYFLLMLAAWRQHDCGLPNDDQKLARIAGISLRKWKAIRGTIIAFWMPRDGRIYQPRLLKEWQFMCKKSSTNRKSAASRWNKQVNENKQTDQCERISERNAPPTPPIREPNGSPPKPPKTYAFSGRTIRLKQDDFDRWQESYHGIKDLRAELQAIDDWFELNVPEDKRGNWFVRVSNNLRRKHEEGLARKKEEDAARRAWELRNPPRKLTDFEAKALLKPEEYERWKLKQSS